jgi:murein peptide amidase A
LQIAWTGSCPPVFEDAHSATFRRNPGRNPESPIPSTVRFPTLIVLALLLAGCASSRPAERSAPAWQVIGHSINNRPLEAATFGRGPNRVYLIGGIHGDEPEGQLAAVTATAAFPRSATVRVLRDANPDGTRARTRGNTTGRDLNRNWPASNFRASHASGQTPLSEPETAALHRDLHVFAPHVVIVFHSSRSGPFVNYDGPAAHLARAFAAAAAKDDPRWRVVPDMGYPTPGSLGSYIGRDRGIPILTIEFRRGQDAGSAWVAARAGLAAVLSAPRAAALDR